jgi:glycosyltransferase involved in cell wall biosynthesis
MSAPVIPSGHSVPPLSIVIPAYNYARFLPQAIDSALNQTLPTAEVLVIDDGSTDETAQLVATRYGRNPRVRYLYQPNAGLSAARNTGIRNARGEFVAFLDADDLLKPEFVQEVVALFARLPEPYAMVATRTLLVDGEGNRLPRKQIMDFVDQEITCADILLKTRCSPTGVVVRRKVFETCGDFDTTLRSAEDRDMWIRIAARYRIFFCGRALNLVRRHGPSMSTHTDRMKQNTRRVLEKARRNPDIDGLPPLYWWKVYAFFHFQAAWMYFEEGRRPAALRDLLLSFVQWPWFGTPRRLNEPVWFRLRTLKHFLFAPKLARK